MSTRKFNRLTGLLLLALLMALTSPVAGQGDPTATPAPTEIALANVQTAVTLQQANLRPTPAASGTAVSLASGTRLTINNPEVEGASVTINGFTSDIWLEVTTPAGQHGFISQTLIGYEVTDPYLPNIVMLASPVVSENDLNTIAAGAWVASEFQNGTLGSPLPLTTIRVLNADRSPMGDNSAAVATDSAGNGPYLSLLNPSWISMDTMSRALSTSHELMHRWQIANGCLSYTRLPLGHWLTEGWAEWSAQQASVNAGWLTDTQAQTQEIRFFTAGNVVAPTLSTWVNPANAAAFQANYGYNWSVLAVRKLVEDYGTGVLTDLCAEAAEVGGSYSNFPRIFESVTGQTPAEFEAEFLTYVGELGFVASEPQIPVNVGANGCGSGSAALSRIRISCQGVNPDARQAGFIIQPAANFDEIDRVILPTGASGRWEASTEIYFVRFATFEWERMYTVTFVINDTEYPFTFAFRR